MPRIALTEGLADEILQVAKVVNESVVWVSDPEVNYFKASVSAEFSERSDLKASMKVHINVNKSDQRKVSITLVVSAAYPIFRLDVHGSHQNRHTDANVWHWQPHKHRWTDNCRDAFAFTPAEIVPTDPEGIFREFCVEANIDFQGNFDNVPPIQLRIL